MINPNTFFQCGQSKDLGVRIGLSVSSTKLHDCLLVAVLKKKKRDK